MKIFKCVDTDGGNETLIVAENIKKCIDLFEDEYNYCPEKVSDYTADNEHVIVQNDLVKMIPMDNYFQSNIALYKDNRFEIIFKLNNIDHVIKVKHTDLSLVTKSENEIRLKTIEEVSKYLAQILLRNLD